MFFCFKNRCFRISRERKVREGGECRYSCIIEKKGRSWIISFRWFEVCGFETEVDFRV